MCIKMDLALNNLQWLLCHKTKQNQTKWSNGNEVVSHIPIISRIEASPSDAVLLPYLGHPILKSLTSLQWIQTVYSDTR